jgi:hypothetical protein
MGRYSTSGGLFASFNHILLDWLSIFSIYSAEPPSLSTYPLVFCLALGLRLALPPGVEATQVACAGVAVLTSARSWAEEQGLRK